MKTPALLSLAALLAAPAAVACGDDGTKGSTADTAEAPDSAAAADTAEAPDSAAAADTVEAADTAPPPAEWRHTEAVVEGEAAALVEPFFVEVSGAALAGVTMAAGRAMVVDFDGDGHDDLVSLPTNSDPMSPTFARWAGLDDDGTHHFEDVTAQTGMADAEATIMVFADVDNDGDQDVFTGVSFRAYRGKVGVWANDGQGHFSYLGAGGLADPVVGTYTGGYVIYKEMAAAGFADLDGDGLLDLYLGLWRSAAPGLDGAFLAPPDELYRGDGQGNFAQLELPIQVPAMTLDLHPTWADVGRNTYGLAMADYDDDGDVDIFVNNYGAGRPAMGSAPNHLEQNILWRNDGGWTFTDVGVEAGVYATERGIGGVEAEAPVTMGGVTYGGPIGGNGFGCQWGDLDNDGDLDLAVGTIAHPDYPQSDRTTLHYNQGDGTFSEQSAARGLEYYEDELHPGLVDLDNDGRLDFVMSRLRGGSKLELYDQQADGTFRLRTHEQTGIDVERPGPNLWLDYDGDGDLDMFMPKGAGRIWENRVGDANGHLVIRLEATAPRDATGARVTLKSSAGIQVREITAGTSHYNVQLTRGAYFGLGGDSGAREVTIRWPDGEVQTLGDVRAGYQLKVVQGGEVEVLEAPRARE
ncbi:MAG: hypothetical protein CSA66_01800 [Proteobacteria bacterium]|nr:MAG: hypothetical protein CSA66_01800 [Pseudomonadota bacterium]